MDLVLELEKELEINFNLSSKEARLIVNRASIAIRNKCGGELPIDKLKMLSYKIAQNMYQEENHKTR